MKSALPCPVTLRIVNNRLTFKSIHYNAVVFLLRKIGDGIFPSDLFLLLSSFLFFLNIFKIIIVIIIIYYYYILYVCVYVYKYYSFKLRKKKVQHD